MARAELKELYLILMDTRFDFIPRGEISLQGIYEIVKLRYPELCDDDYLCSMNCTNRSMRPYGKSPEWNHTIRAVLKKLREHGTVTAGSTRGMWLLGIPTNHTAEAFEHEAIEGRALLKLHKMKERKPQIVRRKKRAVLADKGRLVCEACDFDFAWFYGKLGEGFAECHHRSPLAELDGQAPTRLADLAIVCSNCHRMLHRSRPMMSVEQLRSLVLGRRLERLHGGRSAT